MTYPNDSEDIELVLILLMICHYRSLDYTTRMKFLAITIEVKSTKMTIKEIIRINEGYSDSLVRQQTQRLTSKQIEFECGTNDSVFEFITTYHYTGNNSLHYINLKYLWAPSSLSLLM